MKVKAIQPAFFNGSRVRGGQDLDVPSGTKGSWFVRTEDFKPEPAKKAKAQPTTLSELAKTKPAGPTEVDFA